MGNGSGLFSDQGARLPHLVDGKGGVPGEIDDLRRDVAGVLAALMAQTVDEFNAPAAADVDAIKVGFSSAAGAVTYSGADLDGVVGGGAMSPPRNITIDTTVAATGFTDCTVTGKDIDGNVMTEAFTGINVIAQHVGAKAFAEVTELAFSGGTDAAATHSVGFGTILGLSKKLKIRGAGNVPMVMLEVDNDSTVLAADAITATFAAPTVGEPNGTVDPTTAPAGADYIYVYEYDPTA